MPASQTGSTISTTGSITDASGNVWTITGGVISVNGVVQTVTHGVTLLYFDGAHVWQQTAQGWWEGLSVAKNIVAWGAQTTDPRPTTSPPPVSMMLTGTFTANGAFSTQLPAFAEITAVEFQEAGAVKVPISLGTVSGAADIMDPTMLNPTGLAGGDVLPVPADSLLSLAFVTPQSVWVNSTAWGGATVVATVWFDVP